MKFYKRDIPGLYLPGTIWNPNTSRRWCGFGKSGVVETEDPQLIEVLLKYGYPHDEVKETVLEEVSEAIPEEITEVVPEVDTTEVPEEEITEVTEEEISEDGVSPLTEDIVVNTEAPEYETNPKPDINTMTKAELEIYAREEFGVELDKRHTLMVLREEVSVLREKALEL